MSKPLKSLFVLGTRPEAVKLCPVILHMHSRPHEFEVRVCATAQHREMLDRVLEVFGIAPDDDLDVMQPRQTLAQSTARILAALEPVLASRRPGLILVQGDTTTTFCGALAGFYHHIPVAHVEAGLRTGNMRHPFPEEMNRVLTTRLATLHFAPTEGAAANLLAEGVDRSRIFVTGNPGIDAVLSIARRLETGELRGPAWPQLDASKKLIAVTAHRRESFGDGFDRICSALRCLARRPDVEIVYPVHRNPHVSGPVRESLGGLPNVFLVDPLDYVPFVDLMRRSYLLLTDSGGIQEEGPSLGKPVLVMRETTERPEAVQAGTVKLLGTDTARIVGETVRLLEDPAEYRRMSLVHNPYGDGQASRRIAEVLASGADL